MGKLFSACFLQNACIDFPAPYAHTHRPGARSGDRQRDRPRVVHGAACQRRGGRGAQDLRRVLWRRLVQRHCTERLSRRPGHSPPRCTFARPRDSPPQVQPGRSGGGQCVRGGADAGGRGRVGVLRQLPREHKVRRARPRVSARRARDPTFSLPARAALFAHCLLEPRQELGVWVGRGRGAVGGCLGSGHPGWLFQGRGGPEPDSRRGRGVGCGGSRGCGRRVGGRSGGGGGV